MLAPASLGRNPAGDVMPRWSSPARTGTDTTRDSNAARGPARDTPCTSIVTAFGAGAEHDPYAVAFEGGDGTSSFQH